MSKAPNSDVENYDGKGDWFKIASAGPINDTTFALWRQTEMMFNIPKTTPPGKYLLRMEQFQPSQYLNGSQWYINCAQINVIGNGTGKFDPTDLIRFPGGYDMFDTGTF